MENEGRVDAVSFLLVSPLKGVCFNPLRTEPLKFESESPKLTFRIRSRNRSSEDERIYDNLECVTSCKLPTSSDNVAFVTALTQGKYLPIKGAPLTLPVRVKGEERIDADGAIHKGCMIPFELYPPGVQDLWKQAYEHLRTHQDRFLKLIRWSQGIQGSHEMYDGAPALYWAPEHESEHHAAVAPKPPPQSASVHGIVWEETQEERLRELWEQEGVGESLAHELLREAKSLAAAGARHSALLMTAVAVEVGVKQHIGRVRPDTDWLLRNAPSPPIHKILRRYVPQMHTASTIILSWDELRPLWKASQDLVEARNEMAHAGKGVPMHSLWTHIDTGTDILYLLDALEGHMWARTRVSSDLRARLNWPSPAERRLTATIDRPSWDIDNL